MTKVKSWSLSTLNLFEQCAFKYKCIKIDKMVEPPSYALQKGIAAHSKAEDYLTKDIPLPNELKKFTKEFINLKKHGALAEEALVFKQGWEFLGTQDHWFHQEAWLRMKLDARIEHWLCDFKTGKHYETHIHQARLYSNGHMRRFPDVDEVDVEFWYLGTGDVKSYTFTRADLNRDLEQWNERAEKIEKEEEFKPTKNQYCKYCAFINICPAHK